MGKHDVIHKTRSTSRISLLSEEDRAMDPENMHRKFCELSMCGLPGRQTDMQTRSSQYFVRLLHATGGEVITSYHIQPQPAKSEKQ